MRLCVIVRASCVAAGPNASEVRKVMTAFDDPADGIRGNSEGGLGLWPLKDTFINAYRYVMIRSGSATKAY